MGPHQTGEKDLIEAVTTALRALPDVVGTQHVPIDYKSSRPDRWNDADIVLEVGDRLINLVIEVKLRSIYPRDVREALWTLRNEPLLQLPSRTSNARVPMLVAHSLSRGAKAMLQEERVGYYDTGGSLYIPGPDFYVFIDKPEPKPIEKANRVLFRGKRAQVIHALLERPGQWISVKDIAEKATVSAATASETMSLLDRFEWMSSRGNGPSKERCLQEPGRLLDEWVKKSAASRAPNYQRYYVPLAGTEEIARRVANSCLSHKFQYVVTGESAAQRYAPYLSSVPIVKCKITSADARNVLIADLSAQPVSEGSNLQLEESHDSGDFLFRKKMDDVWVASAVLVYLDLIKGSGRAAEAATHLRQHVLGY